ncbi:MAG: PKD domain-containing protein [Bacteroidetes bacterium]|nr:PKD domain-containing protein [Bacteroidota bacterium]HET6243873.1 PKD domain-containing protein [Bacteroidia bacterium]
MKNSYFLFAISCLALVANSLFAQVSFNMDNTTGCKPLTVSFTNTSSVGNYYEWYMDESFYSIENPTHTFMSSGSFYVNLTVYDTTNGNMNYIGSHYDFILVIGANFYSTDSICPNDVVYFYAEGNNLISQQWYFGDGTSSMQSGPNHSYSATGTYDVKLVIESAECGKDSITKQIVVSNTLTPFVYFDYYPSSVCPGMKVNFYGTSGQSYFWDFGDGTTSTLASPKHTYAQTGLYQVAFTLTNACGNSATEISSIEVTNDYAFSSNLNLFAPDSTCPGQMTSFYVGADANFALYEWNFGDGGILTGNDNEVSYNYLSTGTFNVSVKITQCNKDTTLSSTIVVNNNVTLNENDVDFGIADDNVHCPGDNILFYVQGGNSAVWNFGDGVIMSTPSDTLFGSILIFYHAYTGIGTYNATVTITNACGNSYTDQIEVVISNVAGEYEPYFVLLNDQNEVETCEPVTFWANGGKSFKWNFGDGSIITTTQALITHTYTIAGTYEVTLTATNGCNDTATVNDQIIVTGTCVGVNVVSHNLEQLVIYPNPAQEILTIKGDFGNKPALFTIYNMLGKQITAVKFSNDTNSFSIDLNQLGLTSGIYMLVMEQEGHKLFNKFSVIR